MPVYEYTGINKAGKRKRGELDAESPRILKDMLRAKGIFLIEHAEGANSSVSSGTGLGKEIDLTRYFGGNRIPPLEIALLTRQLATLQRAGIPLIETLNAVVEQIERPNLKRILSDVRTKVNEGSALANALSEHPKVFSNLYVNMVRAGESSGNLDLVLERLSDFLEASAELRGKVMSALYYPVIMTLVGAGVMSFLFLYVIPKVTQIFEDQGQALPLITQALIWFTGFITKPVNILLMFGLFSLGLYFFRKWKATDEGQYKWDKFVLTVPVFGETTRLVAVTRFSKTLSTLLASGVPLLSSMDIVKAILGNARLVEVIDDVRSNVREGDSIAAPLRRSGEFPPLVTHMIAIGERTGRLENMLNSVAEAYQKQVDNRLRAMTSLLEPLMIVMMGIVVAFIVFAILVPILQLGQGFM